MKFYKGHKINVGRICTEETKKKISEAQKGKMKPPQCRFPKGHKINLGNTFAKGNKPNKTTFKKGLIPWNKNKKYPQISGKKHHRWKGGITPIHNRIRHSLEYKLWRKSVFERDNYTCVWCGDNRGGNLNADHIKPFAYYPELRFAIDNGRTLCKPCHKKTNTWGNRKSKDGK